MTHRKRTTCRGCGGTRLRPFLSFGLMPLANSFLCSPDDFPGEAFYPLDVYVCDACSLVQLLDVIDPEVLFRHYLYLTGTSETIAAHHERYAATLVDVLDLRAGDLVVEIASNDGSLLRRFKQRGLRTLGVEPAANIAAVAAADGIDALNLFFDAGVARQIREAHGPANAVLANNVLAHVDDTRDFLLGCKELIAPDGTVVIEVPSLRELLDRLEYDTIYHEHLCYFSLTTLVRMCDTAGLSATRLDRVPVHGGSLRIYARPRERARGHAASVLAGAEEERKGGLTDFARYERFAADVQRNRAMLLDLLAGLTSQGRTVAGYGAPAKATTLLNYCGIGPRLLPYTVDRSPLKVGRYTPGAHIPVLPVSTLLERQPDYVLLLAWNLAEEIMSQQADYRRLGGRFIIPIPTPMVV